MKCLFTNIPKQPSRGVLRKRCSENMQQIYKRTPIPKCGFNEVASNFIKIALWDVCSPVNLLHIFRTVFPKNISGGLQLKQKNILKSSLLFQKNMNFTGE